MSIVNIYKNTSYWRLYPINHPSTMTIQTTHQNTFQSDDKFMSRSVAESQNNISDNLNVIHV